MATVVKKDSSVAGTVFDLSLLAIAFLAVFGFIQGYKWWTEYRIEEVAGASCLRELDADCALAAMNEYYGPHNAPSSDYSDSQGQWLWTLRLLKTRGSLDSRLDELMVTPRDYWPEDKSVPFLSFPSLLEVTTVLYTVAGSDAGSKFHDAVLAKQEALGGQLSYKQTDKRFVVQSWGPSMSCRTKASVASLRKRTALSELLLTEEISHPCMLEYFADKDDATLKAFIERNLDAMQAERLKYGQAWYGKGFEHMPSGLYADNIAFLASIIAYRERGGFGI